MLSRTTIARSGLMVLAGAYEPLGSLAASTAPLSRSATSQACAGPSGGATTAPAGCTSGCADAAGAVNAAVTTSAVAANSLRTDCERMAVRTRQVRDQVSVGYRVPVAASRSASGLLSVACHDPCAEVGAEGSAYSEPMLTDRSCAKPQSSRLAAWSQ